MAFKYIVSLTVATGIGLSANAQEIYVQKFATQSPMDIASVHVTQVVTPVPAPTPAPTPRPAPGPTTPVTPPPSNNVPGNDCSKLFPNDLGPIAGIDWGTIVSIGEKIWQIVEANKPVVTVNTPVANALPRGLTCWTELEHWHAPATKTYEVVYKNGFGTEVVKFRFNQQFNYGGGKGEFGQYIANATIVPLDVQVDWAYTFDANVAIGDAVNLGTLESPIAGLTLNVDWTVKTVLREVRKTFSFFIQGDGTSILNN